MFLQSIVPHHNPPMTSKKFCQYSNMSLINPAFRLILGDFKCRPNSWRGGDISKKRRYWSGISLLVSWVSRTYHKFNTYCILPQSSSCTDLTFSDQPSLEIDSGDHYSLDTNFHHETTHCQFKELWNHDGK